MISEVSRVKTLKILKFEPIPWSIPISNG